MNLKDRLWVKFEPNKPIGTCPSCKREVFNKEHYSCDKEQCPIQRKVSMNV
jgi:hypothetical protein